MEQKKNVIKGFDAIVIGAGVAGLAAALKLTSSGKRVLVLEKQPIPGGVGTSFKRKGFSFESCLHYVDALSKDGEVRKFLDETRVSEKITYLEMQEFGRVVYPEHDLLVRYDFDSLKKLLIKNFPHESKGIDTFFKQIRRFYKQFDHFSNSSIPLWVKLMFSPILYPAIVKTSCLTFEQYLTKKIKDNKLRAVISTLWGFVGLPPSQLSSFYFLIVLRGCWAEKSSFIKGGFSKLFNAMVERIKENGSEVKFNTAVTRIITSDGKHVQGVVTDKGEEFNADVVISNANAVDTLTEFVDSESVREAYTAKFQAMERSVSAVTLYLGLDVPAEQVGLKYPLLSINTSYHHDKAFNFCLNGEYKQNNMAVIDHSQLDPDLALAGKSTLCVMTFDKYEHWKDLTKEAYLRKKKEVAEKLVTQLEQYLPNLSKHIELMEIGTPKTMERYASLPQGSVYGFSQTVPQSSINRLGQTTSVKGLLLAGAWTSPGCGVHGCFVSGMDAADLAIRALRQQGL